MRKPEAKIEAVESKPKTSRKRWLPRLLGRARGQADTTPSEPVPSSPAAVQGETSEQDVESEMVGITRGRIRDILQLDRDLVDGPRAQGAALPPPSAAELAQRRSAGPPPLPARVVSFPSQDDDAVIADVMSDDPSDVREIIAEVVSDDHGELSHAIVAEPAPAKRAARKQTDPQLAAMKSRLANVKARLAVAKSRLADSELRPADLSVTGRKADVGDSELTAYEAQVTGYEAEAAAYETEGASLETEAAAYEDESALRETDAAYEIETDAASEGASDSHETDAAQEAEFAVHAVSELSLTAAVVSDQVAVDPAPSIGESAHLDAASLAAPPTAAGPPRPAPDPIRTRTMARLLAKQGFRDRALSIYDELLVYDADDASLHAEAEALRARR